MAPRTVVYQMHAAQRLMALCSPNSQETDCVRVGAASNNSHRGSLNRTLRFTVSTDMFMQFSVRFICFRYHFERRNIFAAINISYISVTALFTVLFKTQEHKFEAEDVFLGD